MSEQAIQPVDAERAEIAAELMEQRSGSGLSLQEWYLGEMAKCEFMADRIKDQTERMLREIENRRKALEFRFGAEFRAAVEADLAEKAKGKSKPPRSVKYHTGTAGFRTTPPKLIVLNAKALMDWAAVNCPEAVKMEPTLHVTPIKAHIQAGGELPPGCDYRNKVDKFYPSVFNKELPDGTSDSAQD
jgi:hypothetical protein